MESAYRSTDLSGIASSERKQRLAGKNIYDMTKEIAVLTVNKDYLTAKVLAKFKDDYKYL